MVLSQLFERARNADQIDALQHGFDRVLTSDLEHLLSQQSVADNVPRQFDKIGNPKPFDAGLRSNLLDDHIPDSFIIAQAFAWH